MAKVTLEFDPFEDRDDMENALNGWKWKMVVWDFDQRMRAIYKYEDDHTQEVYDMIEKLRGDLREMLTEQGLNLD